MRILAITVLCLAGALALLLGLLALIGSRLPPSHVATRSTWLRQPTEQTYRLIRDFSQAPSWRSDVSSVELLEETNGKLRYREHGKHGDVTYELVEDLAGQRIVTRIVDQDLGYSGSWIIELMPENGGTRVRITENGEVSNVMFRFISRYIIGHTSTMERYLTSLAQHFGERATVKIED